MFEGTLHEPSSVLRGFLLKFVECRQVMVVARGNGSGEFLLDTNTLAPETNGELVLEIEVRHQ